MVIQAQPFGDTEVSVFDTDFLPVPEGPPPEIPGEPPLPDWVVLVPDVVSSGMMPPIPLPELPS